MGVIKFKECPRCGLLFDCYCQSEYKQCWCLDYKLSAEQLDHLKNRFQNCLCPNCIKEFLENGIPNPLDNSKK